MNSSLMRVIYQNVTEEDLEEAQKHYHPPGRRCANPGCITILNRYNPGPLCLKCEEEQKERRRNNRFLFQ